jgi:hypothetical protein
MKKDCERTNLTAFAGGRSQHPLGRAETVCFMGPPLLYGRIRAWRKTRKASGSIV